MEHVIYTHTAVFSVTAWCWNVLLRRHNAARLYYHPSLFGAGSTLVDVGAWEGDDMYDTPLMSSHPLP